MFYSHVVPLAASAQGPRMTPPPVTVIKLTARSKRIGITWLPHSMVFHGSLTSEEFICLVLRVIGVSCLEQAAFFLELLKRFTHREHSIDSSRRCYHFNMSYDSFYILQGNSLVGPAGHFFFLISLFSSLVDSLSTAFSL